MGLDIRIPIGLMFSIFGLLLIVYGAITKQSEMYSTQSLGININLWWGGAILLFGVIMLLLGRKAAK